VTQQFSPRPLRIAAPAHIAALALACAVLPLAAHPQAKPQPIQPTSQGPTQNAPVPNPQNTPAPPNQPAPASPQTGSPQSTPPHAQGAATSYTTPDNTASVTVPAGWKAQGTEGLITMTGPLPGEAAILGKVTGAHNAPYNPSAAGSDSTGVDMPYASTFQDKVAMLVERLQVVAGRPAPQGSVTSVTPIPVPPTSASAAASPAT